MRFVMTKWLCLAVLTVFSEGALAKFLTCKDLLAVPTLATPYDYVVVGAGAGGAPLASRLAQAGHRVLVLEAGGPAQPMVSQVLGLHAVASEDQPIALDYGVSHYTDPGKAQRDSKYDPTLPGGILYPRGEGLGGSTLVNAGITVLPHRGDFDAIGKLLGDPYFSDETAWRLWRERIENCRYHPVRRAAHRVGQFFGVECLQNWGGHGFDGWLHTTRPRLGLIAKILLRDPQLRKIILTAERENRGRVGGILPYLQRLISGFDPNDRRAVDRQEAGLVLTPLAADVRGRRSGPRNLLLATETQFPDRLHLGTNVVVDRVLFDANKKAIAIEVELVANGLGSEDEARGENLGRVVIPVGREVVLSAGTTETAAVLLRSGIGPAESLERLGIPVVVANNEVGRNLHDRYEVGVISQAADPIATLEGALYSANGADPHFQEWLQQGRGLYTTNGSVVAFTAKSDPSLAQPNLYIFGLPAGFRGYEQGYSTDIVRDARAFTWAVLVAKTKNRSGIVTLTSRDPKVQPQVDFNYFGEGEPATAEDLAATAAGVEIVRKLNASMPAGLFTAEVSPGPAVNTDALLRQWIESEAWGHHKTGTARFGPVLNSQFQVVGTQGLRVADASVFPDIPGYFLVSSVYILSEMAAETILGQRP